MRVIVTENHEALSHEAAKLIRQAAAEHSMLNIVPATGNTPLASYEELSAMRSRGEFVPGKLRVIQLDEYVGVPAGDERSLYGWMDRCFIQPLGVPADHVIRFPDGNDPEAACRELDTKVVAAGGVDLAVLGLGPNGHLGYNEPPSEALAPTRVVALTDESIETAAAYWGGRERVPVQAMTLGMNRLLAARHILLLVSGGHKRAILQKVLHGPVTPEAPASYLQQATNVTVIADREALPEGVYFAACAGS